MSDTLTPKQVLIACRLAAAHGHEWGGLYTHTRWHSGYDSESDSYTSAEGMRPPEPLPSPLTAEAICADAVRADKNHWPGIRCPGVDAAGNIVHVTGTGRLEWEIDPAGRVVLYHSRPAGRYARSVVWWSMTHGISVSVESVDSAAEDPANEWRATAWGAVRQDIYARHIEYVARDLALAARCVAEATGLAPPHPDDAWDHATETLDRYRTDEVGYHAGRAAWHARKVDDLIAYEDVL